MGERNLAKGRGSVSSSNSKLSHFFKSNKGTLARYSSRLVMKMIPTFSLIIVVRSSGTRSTFLLQLNTSIRRPAHASGRAAAYKQTHARILLKSDESRSDGGMKDADITSALGVGQSTVERIRKGCVEEGVESALNRKKQLRRRQKRLDGEGEARHGLRGTAGGACQLDPEALTRVECEIVGTISTETVRQALKKKRTEAVAEAELVHPARSERGVCVRDGRRTGGLPTAVRWE